MLSDGRTFAAYETHLGRCAVSLLDGGESPAIDLFIEAGTERIDDQAEDLVEAFETAEKGRGARP